MNEELVLEQMKSAGLDLVSILPCDRVKRLIPMIHDTFVSIDLTREEVGVGISAGVALAGKRPAMLIQSSGVGTLPNVLCSLTRYYSLPLPILVSWRGHYREGIQAQMPMGEALPGMLKSLGIPIVIVEGADDIPLIGPAIRSAFDGPGPVAILLSPRCFEASAGMNEPPAPEPGPRPLIEEQLTYSRRKTSTGMQRIDALRTIAPMVKDAAVIVNIGIPSKEYYTVGDDPLVFYMLGSLGLASAIGLGVAMFTSRHVVVIDGDGSLLMTPNTLVHLAAHDRKNLTVVAIDNGAHGSTGDQETPARDTVDLELLARASGVKNTAFASSAEELEKLLAGPEWPAFIHVIVEAGNSRVNAIDMDANEIRTRFMDRLREDLTRSVPPVK